MADRTLPAVIGPTETTLRALLTQTLESTMIRRYEEWVLMNMAEAGAPSTAIAGALQISPAELSKIAGGLASRGLLDDETTLSTRGRRELADGKLRVAAMTTTLTSGISAERQQVAREVLDIIRARAADELIAKRHVPRS